MTLNKPTEAKDRIILALDVDTLEEVEKYTVMLKDYVGYFKVGLQLYTSCGYKAIELIKEHGGKVYFDGKFHDIPNTVAKASVNLLKRGIDFFNINASGGSKMISTTVKLCRETAKKLDLPVPTILGVTLLSSFGQRTLTEELNVNENIDEYVTHIAKIAKEAGISGVIASATEAKRIRQEIGEDFMIMCPAIRPTWSVVNDQIRVVSPSDAIEAGVDYMVIGRPITSADDPVAAAKLIINEIEEALAQKEANEKETI
ncbi:MAG: orotidine-5'-phosphate decarboxylase [Candidatus Gastranaerophilales bacterium]|nr:orotidine-5'-phosphate decarboxylase [Candidatus Gastranaerophilales bacterium]